MRKQAVGLASVLLLSLPLGAAAQRDFSQVELTVEQVADNIYMINGTGGNIGVSVGEDGILIVDDKFAPLADKIRAALRDLGGGQLAFILNTHWHGDHTGGNVEFAPEAPIIAHTNVRKRLAEGMDLPGRQTPPAPQEALPVITFDHGLSIHFNGEEIKAFHLPHGHTDGDTVVLFTRSNVAHLGDDFFSGRFPFVDLASGGDVEGLIANVGQLLRKLPPDVTLIPGHGPVSTLSDLSAYHRMLVETTDIVRQKIVAGKSAEDIKAEGLPDAYSAWAWGFISTERWVETIYNSLTRPADGGARERKKD